MVLRRRSVDRRYRVAKRIAIGSRAEVYDARAEDLGRRVALKRMLNPIGGNDELEALFMREATVAATLDHPNVVEVLDVGQFEDDFLLVMELVDGLSLTEVLQAVKRKGERLPIEMVCGIVGQVARGLAHAHERALPDGTPLGIVHRDVCPENVLISKSGVPKLADFGIATLTGREMTMPGTVRGRPQYLSPEQARGARVDARSDLFALGALMFELVSGVPLYDGLTDEAILDAVQHGDYEPIAPRLKGSDPELIALIEKATELESEERFRSARELERRLDRYRAARELRVDSKALAELVRTLSVGLEAEREDLARTRRKAPLEGVEVVLRADDLDSRPSSSTDSNEVPTARGKATKAGKSAKAKESRESKSPKESRASGQTTAETPAQPLNAPQTRESTVHAKAEEWRGPPRKKRLERLERPATANIPRLPSLPRPQNPAARSVARLTGVWTAFVAPKTGGIIWPIIFSAVVVAAALTFLIVWLR